MENKKPAKHQIATPVSRMKSVIIALSDMKRRLSGMMLKAILGSIIGAPHARTSRA
jgi:hypothetical protein